MGQCERSKRANFWINLMSSIPEPSLYTVIVDMSLIWHLAAPNIEEREKGDGTMYTWKDYADKVVESVLKRHKYAERIICLNDPYDLSYTIKDNEHNLRQKGPPIKNVYMKPEDKFPASKDFHVLLSNPKNKIRLQAFLQIAFQSTATKTNVEIIYCVVGSNAKNLTKGQLLPYLTCLHAEADTAMFTIYSLLRSEGYKEAVVLDTEDADNYVQAAYVPHQITGFLCLKRKGQIINA